MRRFSNLIGLDDAPFPRACPKDDKTIKVKVVGAVYASLRLDGVMLMEVERDGYDATDVIQERIKVSKFFEHIQLVMLQGIAFGGFNVVDVPRLSKGLDRPVLVVARKKPDMEAIKNALLKKVRGGKEKLRLMEALGPMEPANGVYFQQYGLSREEVLWVLKKFSVNGLVPEPIRVAHLIAGAIATGISTGRA